MEARGAAAWLECILTVTSTVTCNANKPVFINIYLPATSKINTSADWDWERGREINILFEINIKSQEVTMLIFNYAPKKRPDFYKRHVRFP